MFEYQEGFDFFKLRGPGRVTKVLVEPEKQAEFEEFLTAYNVEYKVDVEDYGIALEEERASIEKGREFKTGFSEGRADFTVYWRYREMEAFIDNLVTRYPQYIQKENLVLSPQGRNIFAVKLSMGSFGRNPIIAMESGMHAREW